MYITDLRKLIKNADSLSDSEKKLYIEANMNYEFTEIIQLAKMKVEEYDADKANRSVRGAIAELENQTRTLQRSNIIFQDMAEKGYCEYNSESSTMTSDLGKMLEYTNDGSHIYARIIHEFIEKPRDVHTMPEANPVQEWFHVSICNGNIVIQPSIQKKPSCIITETISLDKAELIDMLQLYSAIKQGYKLKSYPTSNAKYWLGIFKLLRFSTK